MTSDSDPDENKNSKSGRNDLDWLARQELGTRQFLALRQRQRDNLIELQGQKKIRYILWSRTLGVYIDGVATANVVIMQ